MNTFWMLYVEGKDSPRVMHKLFGAACLEAERIVKGENLPVYVLRAERVYFNKIEWKDLKSEGIDSDTNVVTEGAQP